MSKPSIRLTTKLTALLVTAAAAAVVLSMTIAPLRVLNNLAALGGGYDVRSDVDYGSGPRHRLDVYTPRGAAPATGWPTVVFFYGGSWNSGARADYAFVGAALAARGVLTLVADYRLYPEVRYPDFLTDCALAVSYALEHTSSLGADPKRIVVMGHSAGAYNAAMLALDARWLAATSHAPHELAGWIGLAGPYDFLPSTNPDVQPVFFHPNYPTGAQPIEHAAASAAPPAFIGAPLHDDVVNPVRSSQGLAQRLQAVGASVTLRRYEHTSHASLIGAMSGALHWLAPVRDDVLAFIAQARRDRR